MIYNTIYYTAEGAAAVRVAPAAAAAAADAEPALGHASGALAAACSHVGRRNLEHGRSFKGSCFLFVLQTLGL